MSELLTNLAYGFEVAFSAQTLLYCLIGVSLGTLVGVLPGIGPMAAIAMLLPLTFYLPPATAIVMLAGLYYGGNYGGSTASILLNLPGTPSSAVACLDGYPMAKQGRAGAALMLTTIASFVGASLCIILMMVFAPPLAEAALSFGAADYFSMMVLGLVAAATLNDGSAIKGISMVVIGLLLALVGTDPATGTLRYSFGFFELYDGLGLVALAMGLFGVSEVLMNAGQASPTQVDPKSITWRSLLPTSDDLRRSWKSMLRGTAVGAWFGALPGTGSSISSFLSYALEKRIAKDPSRFGKGAVEGVTAPEAANNAATQAAFIPTMTLGIPGDAVMALLMGALMIHGIAPGPTTMTDHPDVFWGLIASFWIGNVMLFILNAPLVGIWVRIITIPYRILYPTVLMFICIGVYAVNNNIFDVYLVVGAGLIGYVLRLLGFPPAPLLLGFILGNLVEFNFRRALLVSHGDFSIFFTRPISAVFIAGTVAILAYMAWSGWRMRRLAPALD